MFKSIKRANKRIAELELEITSLNKIVADLKSELDKEERDVPIQDFANMRLRAQKAELALEAITQANIDVRLRNNEKNAREREDIKTSILEAIMSHLQNFKVN